MQKLILVIIIACLSFMACKSGNSSKSEMTTVSDSIENIVAKAEEPTPTTKEIQPNLVSKANKIFIDTVKFISASYDYDYWFMDTLLKNDTTMFILDEVYDFKIGDKLEVKWKLDSIPIAGDGESMHAAKQAITVKKLASKL